MDIYRQVKNNWKIQGPRPSVSSMGLIKLMELRPRWAYQVGRKQICSIIWILACLVTQREGIKLKNTKDILGTDLCGYNR